VNFLALAGHDGHGLLAFMAEGKAGDRQASTGAQVSCCPSVSTPAFGSGDAPLTGSVYSPFPGVICDKRADLLRRQKALSLTRESPDDAAEATMTKLIKAYSSGNFDACSFTLTDGISCTAKQKAR
jgi:hypothetical protein